jgi:hypothetical protein
LLHSGTIVYFILCDLNFDIGMGIFYGSYHNVILNPTLYASILLTRDPILAMVQQRTSYSCKPHRFFTSESKKQKHNEWNVWVRFQDFSPKYLTNWFKEVNLPLKTSLCLLIKIHGIIEKDNSKDEERWFMSGPQMSFTLQSFDDVKTCSEIFKEQKERISRLLEEYGVTTIVKIKIIVKHLDIDESLKLKFNPSIITKDNPNIDFSAVSKTKILPPVYGWNYQFKPITCKWMWNSYKLVQIESDWIRINTWSFKETKIYDDWYYESNWYKYSYYGKVYIINYIPEGKYVFYTIYSASGTLITSFYDSALDELDHSKFYRNFEPKRKKSEKKNITDIITRLYIENGQIISVTQNINLKTISSNTFAYNKTSFISSSKIGSFDMECYKDNDRSYVYSLGFYTKQNDVDDLNMFYIDEDKDSNKLVIDCINKILQPKYNNYIFYCHNFGNYDFIFLLYSICQYNENAPSNQQFKIKIASRETNILKATISRKLPNNRTIKIHFYDSYQLLSASLDKLGKYLNVSTKKGVFPYDFVSKNTLFYKGNTPDFSFYQNKITKDKYKNMFSDDWDLKEQTLLYLKDDLICLHQIIDIYSKHVFKEYDTQITESLTKSSLSLKIFLKKFYNDNIPLINDTFLYSDIAMAYFGGITEVYKPYGENLFYYDVNSLYPFAALNPLPAYSSVEFLDNVEREEYKLEDLFGFFYVEIESSDFYIGLLPVRSKSGMYLPRGKWSGWYFSEELKFAKLYGYKIVIKKGYIFSADKTIFTKYINHFFNIKKNAKDPLSRTIAKFFLNGLIGRFGLKLLNSTTSIYNSKQRDLMLGTRTVLLDKQISENNYLMTHERKIDEELTTSFGLDYIKILNKEGEPDNSHKIFKDVSIAIPAAVNAYARIYMNQIR